MGLSYLERIFQMISKRNSLKIPINFTEDFKTFINFIQNNQVKLTKTQQQLSKKVLVDLYPLMSEPKLEVTPSKTQEGYPLLHLFFVLALQLQLIRKTAGKGGTYATVLPTRVAAYQQLTAVEQYLVLLQCFWEKLDWSMLEKRQSYLVQKNIDVLFENLQNYRANKKITIKSDPLIDRFLYDFDHFLFYFSYFGFWQVEYDDQTVNAGKYFIAKTIILKPLFKQLEKALTKNWRDHREGKYRDDDRLDSFLSLIGVDPSLVKKQNKTKKKEIIPLAKLLKPLFPGADMNNIFLNNENKFVAGVYRLKVKFNKNCWRTLQLSSSHTLLDLHRLIQRSFEFNDDHLYSFYMDGKEYSRNCYNCPEDNQGPFVNEAKIGSLDLFEGQRFLYLFDFGDEWMFDIELLTISEGIDLCEARIIEAKGEAPLQYEDY